MPDIRQIGYAWRDRSAQFVEHASIAQAVQQLIEQARGLPPNAELVSPIEIKYLGETELDDPTAPDKQYLFVAEYVVPPVE